MKNLKELALRNILKNINFNYHLCRKNNWKIPRLIGDQIYLFIIKQRAIMTQKSVRLFNYISLTNFSTKNQFSKIINFDFLSDNQLDYLKFQDHTNISCLVHKNFHLTTNHLLINNVKFTHCGILSFENFFNKSITVKRSIHVKNMRNEDFFHCLLALITNSLETLEELTFERCESSYLYGFLRELSLKIPKISKMKSINFSFYNLQISFPKVIAMNPVIISRDELTVLNTFESFCHSEQVIEVLTKLPNLQEIVIMDIFNENQHSLLRLLRKNHSSMLKKIQLRFYTLTKESLVEMGEFLRKNPQLEDVHLEFPNRDDSELVNVLDGLKSSVKNLRKFFVGPDIELTDEIIDKWTIILKETACLEEFDFKNFKEPYKLLEPIKQAIYNCKYKIRAINIDVIINNENDFHFILAYLNEIKFLKVFTSQLRCFDFPKQIKSKFMIPNSNLKALYLTSLVPYESFEIESLANCRNLKILSLIGISFKTQIYKIINQSSKFMEGLEELTLRTFSSDFTDWESVIQGFKCCKNLKFLDLRSSFFPSREQLKYFCKSLYPSRYTLEKLVLSNSNYFKNSYCVKKLLNKCPTLNISIKDS